MKPDPLAEQIAEYYDDPLGYVMDVFPWGEGELRHSDGPDEWQKQALIEIGTEVKARKFDGHTPVPPIRFARASGHDTGKTTLAAWLVSWIADTRPDSIGTVTANTFTQLETKTWAAIKKWKRLAITREWWEIGQSMMYNREPGRRETWFVACQSSSEENSEAFAGQHSAFSTSYYLFDEASAIPDEIWKVAEGGLTDGEPMLFAFGNPTRNTGKFYEAVFGSSQHRWNRGVIDSRNSRISNKQTIAEWLEDYGEDSDFFRVRVRGLAPNASEDQFIDRTRVSAARKRSVIVLPDEPLIAGFDVSGGGAAWNVIRFRRGMDARARVPYRLSGDKDPDRSQRVAVCAEILSDRNPKTRVAAMFVDSAFGAAIVVRLQAMGFRNVFEVNFGGSSPDPHYGNLRAYMYGKMKDWLMHGAIPDDEDLARQICLPGYHLNTKNKLILESKADIQKRGEKSPDDADALALTWAMPVAIPTQQRHAEEEYSWQG